MLKKPLAFALAVSLFASSMSPTVLFAVETNNSSAPWTMEKAEHLARKVYFAATPERTSALYQAGSASAAANIVFPDQIGPSRAVYDSEILALTSSGFNWWDATSMNRLYNYRYARDPYESKAKLFSLFEDIFPVNQSDKISYRDIIDQHDLLYTHTLGNYRNMVKRVLYNNGQPGDYAMGKFLDLLDQSNKNSPNENYARELLQLFLMGEYKPGESKDAGNTRNYEEEDVAALARILTGFVSDPLTHAVSYDSSKHNTSTGVLFLTGALKPGASFAFLNSSGALDLGAMSAGSSLGDLTLDYIFAKREDAIALFLADRIYRFYAHGNPTRQELDTFAAQILTNDFELLPSVRWFISSDMMYTDSAMNGVTYKNPLELAIGTVKLLHRNYPGTIDPLLRDSNLLSRFNWTPYFPGSVFWRDGFDDNAKFYSSYIQNQWVSFSSRVAFDTQSGSYLFSELIPYTRTTLTGSTVIATSTGNTFSGSLTVVSGSVNLILPVASDSSVSLAAGEDLVTSTWSTESGTGSIEVLASSSWSEQNTSSWITQETSSGSVQETLSWSVQEMSSWTTSSWVIQDSLSWSVQDTSSWATEPIVTSTGSNEASSTGVIESVSQVIELPATGSEPTQGPIFSAAISQNETYVPLELTLPLQVTLPKFSVTTSTGELVVYSGVYDSQSLTLTISSGAVLQWTGSTWIKPGSTLVFDPTTASLNREITPDELITMLESQLLLGRKVPSGVRDSFKQFLTTGNDGNPAPFRPSLPTYQTSKIRSLISLMLVQPEYVLATGYDASPTVEDISQSVLSNATGKLVFVELWGGYDWLHGVIPKSEYSDYVSKRTLTGGTIAIDEAHLVDIGDFYLNRALAYGSGWTEPSLKSLYDSNNLRIFNRVGTLKHSRDHDQAQKQIASYASTTADDADWVFGQLVKSEPYSENTISLSGKRPNVFRWGRYINIGPSWAIFSNQYLNTADRAAHLNAMRDILKNRSYPGKSGDAFKAAVRVDEIAQVSKNSGGPDGAGYGNVNNLKFLRTLMTNNVGKSFYIQADGGYDTHSNQLAPQSNFDPMNVPKDLNYNIGRVVSNLTAFFNEMKSTQDLTIIVFSEFGRTIKTNGDLGTDHGQGGGMFVISNNQNLLNSLNQKVYGNISVTKARQDWLGVGIDYRSVYGKIYKALYGLSDTTYFWVENDLLKDVDMTPAKIALSSYEYRSNNDSNVRLSVRFRVESDNFNSDKAGYIRASRPKNANDLNSVMEWVSSWEIDNYVRKPGNLYDFSRDWINEKRQYRLDYSIITNQYAETTRSLLSTTPEVIAANASPIVSGTGNLVFRRFDNTLVESSGTVLSGSWIVLANIPVTTYVLTGSTSTGGTSGTGTSLTGTTSTGITMTGIIVGAPVTIRSSHGVEITASWAWLTNVTSVISSSGWLRWHGWFVLGDQIESTDFISRSAMLSSSGGLNRTSLNAGSIHKIVKIGADTIWVGMRLNRSVRIGIPAVPWTEYQVITTEDGLNWSFMGSGAKYRAESDGMVRFDTQAFSYFALITPQVTPPPTPTDPGNGNWSTNWSTWGGTTSGGSTSGGSSTSGGGGSSNIWSGSNGWAPVAAGGGGGGGGASLSVFAQDVCPNGDMTSSLYDGKCWITQTNPVSEPSIESRIRVPNAWAVRVIWKEDSTFVTPVRVPNTGIKKPSPKRVVKPRVLRLSPETISKIRVPNTWVRKK